MTVLATFVAAVLESRRYQAPIWKSSLLPRALCYLSSSSEGHKSFEYPGDTEARLGDLAKAIAATLFREQEPGNDVWLLHQQVAERSEKRNAKQMADSEERPIEPQPGQTRLKRIGSRE